MSALLSDFLGYTLAGTRPAADEAQGVCVNGVRWTWLGEGILQLEPAAAAGSSAAAEVVGVPADSPGKMALPAGGAWADPRGASADLPPDSHLPQEEASHLPPASADLPVDSARLPRVSAGSAPAGSAK